MDYQPKTVSVNSEYEQDDSSKLGAKFSSTLDNEDLYSSLATTMEVDVSLELLSLFVEDCLSTKGSRSLPLPPPTTPNSLSQPAPPSCDSPFAHFVAIPGKAKRKRRRVPPNTSIHPIVGQHLYQLNLLQNNHSLQSTSSSADPLLLQQTYWLAGSELLLPARGGEGEGERENVEDMDQRETTVKKSLKMHQELGAGSGRRCTHCQAQRTPQWRGGPLGPKTLCNACGVKYKKSGRLLPEYRPANSPTFVSFLHSNSHKRVMEMRMMNASSPTSTFPSSS